jgi:ribosomal-protein-alanine N-acetyltransferase
MEITAQVTTTSDWIETPRTRLRPFERTDAATAFAWFNDPDVMQFIPGGIDKTLGDTQHRINGYCKHQAKHGFSKRLILHRETGEAIGDSGLYLMPDGQRIELGFRLARPYWGQGYALEVGRAWLEWFDANMPGTPLFADVFPTHHRSQKVLKELGFAPSHVETVWGVTMWIYERV